MSSDKAMNAAERGIIIQDSSKSRVGMNTVVNPADAFGDSIKSITQPHGATRLDGESSGGRRSCAEIEGPNQEQIDLMQSFISSGLLNVDRNGPPYHEDLQENEQLRNHLQAIVKNYADSNLIRVVLPFVDEESTVGGVAEYARDLTNADSVISVAAVREGDFSDSQRNLNVRNAKLSVQEKGVEVLDQQDVLDGIDWRKLYQDGVIPGYIEGVDNINDSKYAVPPGKGKGLTMLAGILELYTRDKEARLLREMGSEYYEQDILDDDARIVFHDTDVANPKQYAALEHVIGFPALDPSTQDLPFVKIARMGQGRNNHPVASAVNRIANSKNEIKSDLGTALQKERWFLSGEQSIGWGMLKKMNWANGMCIEMMLNLQKASYSMQDGRDPRLQVADVQPKKEGPQDENAGEDPTGGPDMSREWKMIYSIADFTHEIAKRSKKLGFPSGWGLSEIAKFNRKFACQERRYTVEAGEAYYAEPLHDIKAVYAVTEAVLPSLNLLEQGGYLKQ